MNFPLKYLENYLAEPWLLEGEVLFESGAVENLSEPERHLWTARAGGFEVEAQISPSRVQACSCECETFQKEKGCGHIAALLLAIRSRTMEKPAPRKEAPPKDIKKLTVPGLLHHIPAGELAEFVRDYARQNRPFALALKARFTASLPFEDKKEKYQDLLDATIASVRSKSDQVNFRGGQQLIQITRELLNQAEESLSRNALRETSTLILSVLEKIGPVSRKVTGKDGRLQEELNRAFSLLHQMMLLKPAPDLSHTIWDFALSESQKFVFRKSVLQLAYFRLLHQMAPVLGKTGDLLHIFQTLQSQMETSDPNRLPLLILTHQLYQAAGDRTGMEKHLLEHLQYPEFVLFVVEESLAEGHWKKARFLAEKGLEHTSDPKQSGQLEEHLLQLALREKDREAILHFATSRFLETRQIAYLEHLKNNSGPGWPALADSLLARLDQQPWSIARRDATAHLFFADQRFDELGQYITRLESLDLLSAYGPRWPEERSGQAEQMYLSVIHAYLHNHLGRKPSQRVRAALEALAETGHAELAGRLLNAFKLAYSARQSLMEELQDIHL